MYIHMCMYVRITVCVCPSVLEYLVVHTYLALFAPVCVCLVCVCVCVCVRVWYVCVHACVYVSMCSCSQLTRVTENMC